MPKKTALSSREMTCKTATKNPQPDTPRLSASNEIRQMLGFPIRETKEAESDASRGSMTNELRKMLGFRSREPA